MIFSRTNAGLSGFGNFFDVDFTVYSEGGNPDEGEKEGGGAGWSIDSVFWCSVLKRFAPGAKFKIKPMGSKEFVRPYAEKILNGDIDNSIAVLDRDYDCYRGEAYSHPRIIYTHGYSWENDACRAEVLIHVLDKVHPDGNLPDALADEIRERYRCFLRNINRMVYVDFLCGLNKIKGVDRERFWSLIDTTNPLEYKVKRDKFLSLIAEIKQRKTMSLRYLDNKRISPDCDCYGKILSMFNYQLLREYYRQVTGIKNLARDLADIMMAQAMEYADFSGVPSLNDHYSELTDRLIS